jgi:HAD superfamily hydrolase (TIGR01509 family)
LRPSTGWWAWGGSDLLAQLIGRPDEAIQASWRSNFDRLLPEVRALPGAAALLHALRDRGLTVALATSSPKDLLDELRRKVDADEAIDEAIDSDDVGNAKPAPDVFTVALDRLDLSPDEAVVIGDSVWDVHAARNAGLACIGLETGGFSEHELSEAGAKAIFRDPQDLRENLGSALG